MAIADEIERVAREFVPGDVLLRAVMAQENLNELHAASWFLRNIKKLDELPMLEFNAALHDFRHIPNPWASDVFMDFTVGTIGVEPVTWYDNDDGYVGGWLGSDLRHFFEQTGVTYPEAHISKIAATENLQPLLSTRARRDGLDASEYLAERGRDYVEVSDWLKELGEEMSAVGMAVRIAFDELGVIIPIYFLDADNYANLPTPMTDAAAAAVWSDILVTLAVDMIPDTVSRIDAESLLWISSVFVRDRDCALFAARTGLGKKRFSRSPHSGHLQTAKLDLAAAREREMVSYTARNSAIPHATNQRPSGHQTSHAVPQDGVDGSMTRKERDNLLRIIGGLVELMLSESPGGRKQSVFANQEAIIAALESNFPTTSGLKARNLQARFAEGKRLIQGSGAIVP